VRAVLLAEGKFGVFTAKTAVCFIRYRPDEAVAVIDSTKAGTTAERHIGIGRGIPVLGSVEETLCFSPDTLVIGIAPGGGGLPQEYRVHIFDAIRAGMDVISGLHVFLADDPELRTQAEKAGVKLTDLRRVPDDIPIGLNLARDTKCLRVLTVGTDCNVGKMVAAWEIAAALRARGRDAKFVATGQTGMLLAGDGLAVDRVISDFVSGAVEKLVLDNAHHEMVVVEGQGTLQHPSYSGVTLSLIHGCAPQAMVLVHHPTRSFIKNHTVPILPLSAQVKLYEETAMLTCNPARVAGIALNCSDLDERRARDEVEKARKETGLPATDVVMFGADEIASSLEEMA
jgi:uncharacterized NAD-dependent epimerase/dehydratase family protein